MYSSNYLTVLSRPWSRAQRFFFTVVESTVFVAATTAQCIEQRIYIYKEYKAKSPRLHIADIYPRKQEAVGSIEKLIVRGVSVLY